MKQLIHNGILVPKYAPRGFTIKFKGQIIKLTPKQEEMAVAWVKKLGTEYVEDPVFAKNFFKDFCKALGVDGKKDDFDFDEIQEYVDKERQAKLNTSKEDKKKQAEERKIVREANKEKYGKGIVDGQTVEIGGYIAEPSSIFMGRGKHPLRGRWKEGATEQDIILNLSPDAPRPPGGWKQIVWEPSFMWVAKWDDKLRGREKYVFFSDSSFIKQEHEIEKFDKAIELAEKYDLVKRFIDDNLSSPDGKTRKIATVCYLIDALRMRVGDEKGEDEADTVGATTLSKKNIEIDGNTAKFDFLGKDSVRWKREIILPEIVVKNLKEFMSQSDYLIFDGIRSGHVNEFFSSVIPGISAKVFRTYHASKAVEEYLKKEKARKDDSEEYKKYLATMANLQAAIICNHKRKLPKNWKERLQKKLDSMKKIKAKNGKRAKERLKAMKLKIKLMKETRDYNLNTSLKSYIDPRAFCKWSKKVGFDWKKYYSKTLQRKFSWVEEK